MGSTTRDALAASRAALAAISGTVDLATAEQLLSAGRIIGNSGQLQSILSDPATEAETKVAALKAIFGSSVSAPVFDILGAVVGNRWSAEADLLAGIEELGLRAAADSAEADADIEGELFAFGKTVAGNPELELAISSKLGDDNSKVALIERLLSGKVSPQSLIILRHLVLQPRGRRINALVRDAAAIVADQTGYAIATVTTAAPLAADQLARLQSGLSANYGRQLKINQVIDTDLVGGVRVQIGDDIIDGSVASRLKELRLQLAG
ncbi:MAG TPA: F0F1 ATP synthase subunit delta [Homoserinimonas sp.]|nr:F0F1 ATP synthase subunit delta [Homoserinimonas sp.]